jgi:hypothetical protein
MASIIRIKRSGSATGAPASLAQGELAYTWTNGVEKLYLGTGTETAGAAANIEVIGGKYFTDMLDHTAGTLTADSALIVDSNSKIDVLNVDNLTLDGNTLSSTDTNGAINITPNGAGKTIVTNLYIGDSSTSLQEYIEDISGGSVVGGNVLTATYDDGAGTTTLDLDDTTVTPGSYGSTTQIPTFTVDQQGRLTAAGQVNVATTLGLSDGTVTGSLDLLSDDLSIVEGEGIDVSYNDTSKTFTVSAEDATTTNKGVASFDATDFTVVAGAVSVKSITLGTTVLNPGETDLTLAGLQSLEVDNLTIDGNSITASTGGITLVPAAGQHVSVNNATIQDVADPVNDTDAANKRYVDEVAQGLTTKPQVQAATTANLSGTYANGTAGVGATLNLGPAATLTIDGESSWSQYDGILVKDQTNAFENGRYYVSQVGDALTDWILTRCGYCDEPSEIPGMYIFVTDGTVNANTGWAATVDDPDTFAVGTDDIDFYQFSGAGSYAAGEGLILTGTTFDVNLAANGGLEVVSDELQIKSSIAGDGLTFNNGVVDVVGTANRISVTADAVDIASTYVGQTSITTLGTITTGTWTADVIDDAYISNTLTITGGSINGTPIGATTASTGAFTTLTASGQVTLTNTTNATSEVTGALVVAGGIGVDGDVHGNGTNEISGFVIDGGTY